MAKSDDKKLGEINGKAVADEVVEEDDSKTDGKIEAVSPPDIGGGTGEEVPTESTDMTGEQKINDEGKEEANDEQDPQMDTPVAKKEECTSTVTVTWETEKNVEEGDGVKESGSDQDIVEEETDAVNGKRKAESDAETSSSKKAKTNDGYRLHVGNLNASKKFEEIKDSLASYFMAQSLLVQDITLDKSRKYAYVDLVSEMDLNKALTLNGEIILDKPMKIAEAKVKEDKVKVKDPAEERKDKDARCLFLKNVPYTATKTDILKLFPKATTVRFPGGDKGPTTGIAFVEFKNKAITDTFLENKNEIKLQDRVLIVDRVGEQSAFKGKKAPAEIAPNATLFVNNLAFKVKEKTLKKVFQKAVSINLAKKNGKSRGFAFIEFENVEDAKKAKESLQSKELFDRAINVEFCGNKAKAANKKVLSKTLIVSGLAKETSEETLKSAFEGALSARVTLDKDTGVSRGFGFVDFGSEADCKAAKEARDICEIDGSKVTIAYAKPKEEHRPPGIRADSVTACRGMFGGRARGRRGSFTGGRRGRRGRGWGFEK
ncbi:nucleolin-like [Lampris incognitus]|uniref:nucleolin-like n=1 Tax=Lampris incognitus TaxID=2546036 RepID=UPI0024B625CA|nr:nucleolin-like [Lampris incognitus]